MAAVLGYGKPLFSAYSGFLQDDDLKFNTDLLAVMGISLDIGMSLVGNSYWLL